MSYEAIKPQWVRRLPSSDPICDVKPAASKPVMTLMEQTAGALGMRGLVMGSIRPAQPAKGSATLLSRPKQPVTAPQPPSKQDHTSPVQSLSSSMQHDMNTPILNRAAVRPAADRKPATSQQIQPTNTHVARFVSQIDTATVDRYTCAPMSLLHSGSGRIGCSVGRGGGGGGEDECVSRVSCPLDWTFPCDGQHTQFLTSNM